MNKSYHLAEDNLGLTFRDYLKKPVFLQVGIARKLAFLLFITLFSMSATAQVTTNNGSGLNATYPDLATAITALNGATISSPVTITLTGNETAPVGGFAITATGTAVNTIIINGITSTITANAALVAGTLTDAIFKIIGGDYITIEGFTMTENGTNTTIAAASNNMTEWGIALLNASATDGCQNVTIKGNTIDLDRTYLNTFGIYCNTNHSATDVITAVAATTVAGNDSGLSIVGNTVTDVNNGIVVIGSSISGIENDGLVIGGSLANANTISNFGTANGFSGYANVSTTTQGILMRFVKNYNVSFNTVTSSTAGPSLGTIRGIHNDAAINALTGTIVNSINNNIIAVKSAVAAGAIGGIFVNGLASTATTTVNINNNTINGLWHTVAATSVGNITAISNTSLAKSINIKDNTISNIENNNSALAGGNTILGISNNPATAVLDSSLAIEGNTFSNISNTTGTCASITSLISSSITPAKTTTINNNVFTNLVVNTSGAFTFITCGLTMPAGGSQTVSGNSISGTFAKTGGQGALTLFTTTLSSPSGTTSVNSNNNFSNISVNGTSQIAGWIARDGASVSSGPVKTITNNVFSNWTTGGGSITALTENAGAANSIVSGNVISNMTAANFITGLSVLQNSNATFDNNTIHSLTISTNNGLTGINLNGAATGGVVKVQRNKIYNLTNTFSGATTVVSGIFVSYTGTLADLLIANNMISNLKTPSSTAGESIRGININGAVTMTSPIKVYHNSVHLNATSSGTGFGSTAMFSVYSSAAGIATLDMRNNVFVNNSTATTGGFTTAFRRNTSTDLNNYATTSNNNLFYAGTPSASNLIYYDPANSNQTLATYKTRMGTRDQASTSAIVNFTDTTVADLTITGASIGDINLAVPLLAAVTTDYFGTTRAVTTYAGAHQASLLPITIWNGTAWNNGTPSSSLEAVVAGTYTTTTNGGFTAKKLAVNTGSLTINSGTNITVNNEVINNVGLNGLVVENNANLIQTNNVANSGAITVNRNSNPLFRLDYTMWSSPVTGSQTLLNFSPATLATRFYTYDTTLGATGLYTAVGSPSTTTFATGTGYLIRMPDADPATNYNAGTGTLSYAGAFTGTPNNGTVTLGSVTPLTSDKFYAVGNPYPSTIGAQLFLNGNSTDGVLYFWRKKNADLGTAYATFTTGGATTTTPTSAAPDGTIAVGQGFIVKTGLAATTLSFTNAMRTGNNTAQFFKTRQLAQKDRVWLNLTNATGVFSQALVAYIADATTGIDMYDGKYINDSPIALTSRINNEEYTIQGRPTFDAADVVALNFKTDVAGEYTIAIDHVDGLFATGQDIYLLDSKTGIETNLSTTAYPFTAAAAVDNARFSLKFQKTLKVDAAAFNDNSVIVYKNNGVIYVNSGAKLMNNIKVFDIQGRLVAEQKNLKANTTSIQNLVASNQILIVKVTTEDNQVISKKVEN